MKQFQTDTISTALQDTVATDSSAMDLGTLYEPPPVAFSFEPIGWSLLAGLLVVVLLLVAFVQIRKYVKNRYRREALEALENIHDPSAVPQIFVILKRVAMQAFDRERVGNLYGKDWLMFLEKTGKYVQMLPYEKQLIEAIYKGETVNPDVRDKLLLNSKKWIKTHASQL